MQMSNDMKLYIGTKVLKAKPMTRGEYNTLRGWTLPADERAEDEGYVTDNGAGHIQWQPKDVFEDGFCSFNGMDFGMAIAAMKKGMKVARSGWNGKGMFLFLVPGSTFKVNRAPLLGIYPEGTEINYCPHIDMKTADEKVVPWLASQTDVLAEDWQIVE